MTSLDDIKARAERVKHLRTPLGGPDGSTAGYIPVSDAERALADLIIELAGALEGLEVHQHQGPAKFSNVTGPPLDPR